MKLASDSDRLPSRPERAPDSPAGGPAGGKRASEGPSYVVAAGADGGLRLLTWDAGIPDSHAVTEIQCPTVTALALDPDASILWCGTASGALLSLPWPPTAASTPNAFPAHAVGHHEGVPCGLVGLKLARNGRIVVTAGGDGALIVHAVCQRHADERSGEVVTVRSVVDVIPLAGEARDEFNLDAVLALRETELDSNRIKACSSPSPKLKTFNSLLNK